MPTQGTSIGRIYKAPASLANAEAVIWDPGTNSAVQYEVRIFLCNEDTSAHNVTVGIDVGAGGGLAAGEYILKAYTIPANSVLDLSNFPFFIDGDDTIRGFDGGGDVHVVSIHLNIRQVW